MKSASDFLNYVLDKYPLLFSIVICFGLIFYAYGCEAKTKSLLVPERKVTRNELETEFKTLLDVHKNRLDDLQQQEKMRDFIFNQTLLVTQGNPINPIGVITSLLAILGIGAGVDDVRVRKKLKRSITFESKPDGVDKT